jgi:broad specificity phosphatase PhoE
MPGVELDRQGREQMMTTADAVRLIAPHCVHSSPQLRALQSAAIVAVRCGLVVEIVPAFDEIDVGLWTGANFVELASDKAWRRWNENRAGTRPPEGETMEMLQRRVVNHIELSRGREGGVVIVSHAEPIRAALMHYLKVPLDRFDCVAIDPASISTISLEGTRARVSCLNGEVMA